jgi:hypothetical protein
MQYISNFYVLSHQYSDSPWNAKLYESVEEAVNDLKDSPHRNVLYVMKLSDFIWQAANKKLSPRAIKISEIK